MFGDETRDDEGDSAENGRSRRSFLRATGVTAVAGVGVALGAGSVAADSVTVPDEYETVQEAVDAAEGSDVTEIVVTGGSYEGTLTVDVEDLTVRTDAPGGATVEGSDSETGAAVSIEADGVVVAGFEVRNPGNLLGVKVQAGYDDVTVRDTLVHDVGPFTRLGTTGIAAGGGNTGLRITGNTVENVSSELGEESGYPTTNGVLLDDEEPAYEDVLVADNVVRDLRADIAPIGVGLQGDLTDVTVRGNEVTGLSASSDSDEVATFAQGINVTATSTTDVLVERNVLDDVTAEFFNGEGVKVDDGAEGLTVEFNDLLPTVGLNNGTETTVTATCNYWSHPKGPREVESNRAADDGPTRQGRSAVVGPADTATWLVRSVTGGENLENACIGGEGGPGGPPNGDGGRGPPSGAGNGRGHGGPNGRGGSR
jgi:hypothetical protein